MKFSGEMRDYSNLTESVVAATRKASVKSFQDLGIQVSSWRDIQQLDSLEYEQMAGHMIGHVRYTEANVTLPHPLLGAVRITIRNSQTPLPYILDGAFDDSTCLDFLIAVVDSPLKHVEFQFGKSAKPETGRLFITPDSPPAAVHHDDVQYVMDNSKLTLEYDDTRIPGYVKGAFGNQSIEYLTPFQCTAIANKILTSDAVTMRIDE